MPDSARPDAEPPLHPAETDSSPPDGSANSGLAEHAARLRERLADMSVERAALMAERRAVRRLLDRLRQELVATTAGVESQMLLTAEPAEPPAAAVVTTGDLVPIVVAGTGRSGTTATAMLLDGHADVATAPVELRFHASMRRGLMGLLAGALTLEGFTDLMRTHWFRRDAGRAGEPDAGLYRMMSHDELESALAAFTATWPDAPEQACRDLIEAPIRALTAGRSLRAWVEHTPANLLLADRLNDFFPDMRFVHVLRDGRDVASSVLQRAWGTDDLVEGIRWWGHRVITGHRRSRNLPAVLDLRFERLAITHRDEELERLMAFVGLEADAGIRERFATEVRADLVHQGRWRDDVPPEAAARVDAAYRGVLERLRLEGVAIDDLLADAPELDEHRLQHEAIQQELYELRFENRLLRRENLELGAIAAAGELGAAPHEVLARMRAALRSIPESEA